MAFSVVFVLCVVSLAALVSSQNEDIAAFDKMVRNGISKEAFHKLFSAKNAEKEAQEADRSAEKVFQDILGVKLDKSTVEQIAKQAKRLVSEHKLKPDIIAKGYLETIERSLQEKGVLHGNNVSKLAKQLVSALEAKAKSLSDNDSYKKTFPALISVIASYFKSLGLNTQEFAEMEQKVLVDELKKL